MFDMKNNIGLNFQLEIMICAIWPNSNIDFSFITTRTHVYILFNCLILNKIEDATFANNQVFQN